MADAHTDTVHLTILECYPAHEPRASDPHYHVFNEARARLKKLGKLVCWISNADCDQVHPIELHHSQVEFALANIVDVAHFRALYPEFQIARDEDFLDWIEGEGNLLPLCKMHHTGILGVHSILYPAWLVQRVEKTGVTAPMRRITAAEAKSDATS